MLVVPDADWEKVDHELAPTRRWAHEKVLTFQPAQMHR
jgi:hypothetical protein